MEPSDSSTVTPQSTVSLADVTRDSVGAILDLKLSPEQRRFVASNAVSIAQAHFEKGAWFRAIEADGTPVGFVMLLDPTIPGAIGKDDFQPRDIWLWRLMIDHRQQGRGIGRKALDLIVAHARSRPGIGRLMSSYVPGDDGPRDFYLRYGFSETGEDTDDGAEMEIAYAL